MPLRVLLVNKFLYPVGGTEAYLFALRDLLEQAGHEVLLFGPRHPRNVAAPHADLFPAVPLPALDGAVARPPAGAAPDGVGPSSRAGGAVQQLRAAGHVLYARGVAAALDRLLRRARPHVAHLHNVYHHLSPAVLYTLRRHRIPAVLHLHDYKLICANYRLFTGGAVCERCRGGRHYHAVLQRCCAGGWRGSLLGAAEMYLHDALGSYRRLVDRFVAPSRFLRDRLAASGFPTARVRVLPNFVDPARFRPDGEPADGAVVYVGRVTVEKGVGTLLEAAAGLPQVTVRVVGEGPALPTLREAARRRGLAHVHFLGAQPPEAVRRLVGRAAVLVLPSLWYENCPVAVLEAFALGVPVVASRIGGIPELVEDGRDGRLVPPGDAAALRDTLDALLRDPAALRAMGRRAREKVDHAYGPACHLEALEGIYREALARDGRASGQVAGASG